MNAIILAAGMGTRLRPLTDDRPKVLVEVAGESFFARQIRQLRSAGVAPITVITGYRAEAFRRWAGEADIEFVHNDHFDDRNNIWSMRLVGDRLGDTIVLDGDLRLADGVIPAAPPAQSSWYVGWRDSMQGEWVVRCDESGRVHRIDVAGGSGWILTGLSYWNAEDGALIARRLSERVSGTGWEGLYWDEIPRSALDLITVHAVHIPDGSWVEIDSLEDKATFERSLADSSGAPSAAGPGPSALDRGTGRT
ncbi:MAG TPA: phosphocholine cytidylyltransferase family protein [Rectinemataceae bacterium]|nr:phosphocholine cytidylyltransferase family protein [Rectinemataceae bacterium]